MVSLSPFTNPFPYWLHPPLQWASSTANPSRLDAISIGFDHWSLISSMTSYLKDSVILCDGHNRLQKPKFAGTPNGRFVFILGNMHVRNLVGMMKPANEYLWPINLGNFRRLSRWFSRSGNIFPIGCYRSFPIKVRYLPSETIVLFSIQTTVKLS